MNHIIGRQSWSSLELWTEELEKTKFLYYLKKDLPDHRICHRCIELHCEIPLRDVQLTQFVPEEPERKQKIGVAYSYPPINITFQQVQSALNRHHLGHNHGLSRDFFHRPLLKGPLGLCLRPSTKARIVADEFILRSNYWIPKWPDRTGPDPNPDNPVRLCPHMTIYYGDPRIMEILNVDSIIARIAIAQVANTVISVQQSSTWSFAVERPGRAFCTLRPGELLAVADVPKIQNGRDTS